MKKLYTFTTTRGQVCCAADDPALLCSQCRRQAALATTKSGHKLPRSYTAALATRINKPAPKPYTEALKARGKTNEDVIREPHGSPKPYSTALKRRASAAQ